MGVRRRAIRERVDRDRARRKSWDAFSASLARLKRVVDDAIAEGFTTLTPEQFGGRLRALEPHPDADGHCTRCGLEFEDPKELTHECPPGFENDRSAE